MHLCMTYAQISQWPKDSILYQKEPTTTRKAYQAPSKIEEKNNYITIKAYIAS